MTTFTNHGRVQRVRGRSHRTRSRNNTARSRKWQTLARKRGIQRWSALLSATSSRLAKTHGMKDFLGHQRWRAFVKYATEHYREDFISAFVPTDGVLWCGGPLQAVTVCACCPQQFRVDVRQLGSSDAHQRKHAGLRLGLLHIDHAYDVQHICETWKRCSGPCSQAWDAGIDADKLCRLLFKIAGDDEGYLTFRCAVPSVKGQRPCHLVASPHYAYTLTPAQIRP